MFSKDNKKRLYQIECALKYNKNLTESGRKKLEQMRDELVKNKVTPNKKNLEKKKNKYGIKKGDVFMSSWGYDATFHDFYEVTDVLGDTRIKVKELAKSTGTAPGYGANDWTVRPIKHEYADDTEYIRNVKSFSKDQKDKTGTLIKDKYKHNIAMYVENPFDRDWHEDNYH